MTPNPLKSLLPKAFVSQLNERVPPGLHCKETLIRKTSPLLPKEKRKTLELHRNNGANIECSVWRDPAGEISVWCEANPR